MSLEVFGQGRLVKDPVYASNEDKEWAKFCIASDMPTKADGVSYTDVMAFGYVAKVLCKYFVKGDGIIVFGTLQQVHWEKEGNRRTKHIINLRRFEFPYKKKQIDKLDPEIEQYISEDLITH